MKKHTIDATDKTVGVVASEVASVLRGKDLVSFASNKLPDVSVEIVHASKIKVTGKKMDQKEYKRYSGYPGGLRTRKMSEVIEKKGYKGVFEHAVRGMLPANRLRNEALKRLTVID